MALTVDNRTGSATAAPGRSAARRSWTRDKMPGDRTGIYDEQGRYVTPGLDYAGGGKYAEFVPGSGVPNTQQASIYDVNGNPVTNQRSSPYVGVPYGSSLYLQIAGKRGGTIKGQVGLQENTYKAFDNFFNQSPAEIELAQKRLLEMGWLTESDIGNQWGWRNNEATRQVVAQLMYEGNLSGSSWQEIAARGAQSSALNGTGPGGGGGPTTQVNTATSLTTQQDARLILRQAMQQVLGRDPKDDEVRGFLRELNTQERENPTVTTMNMGESGDTATTDTTTEGGFNPQEFAESWTESSFPKQANKYKAQTYEDMALDVIRGL